MISRFRRSELRRGRRLAARKHAAALAAIKAERRAIQNHINAELQFGYTPRLDMARSRVKWDAVLGPSVGQVIIDDPERP